MKQKCLGVVVLVMLTTLLVSLVEARMDGVRRKKLRPHEYGNVVINNFSEKNNIEPAVFPHWVHRARFTCRVCHIDIGFAMRAGETKMKEDDNMNGMYCGTCHNGKIAFGPKEKDFFEGKKPNCERCHSLGKDVKFKNDFYAFQQDLPRDKFGNRIDWLKAEEANKVKLVDYVEGVSFERKQIKLQRDFAINPKVVEMPDIIFSHEKHAKWNGCELCHPDLFGVKRGAQPYTMQEIFQGKYCGACHDLVAFPNIDCQKCHTKAVY